MTTIKKALNTANIQGLTNQIDKLNSAHELPDSQDSKAKAAEISAKSDAKAIFTLIAQFALAGYAVHKGQSGDFTVSKYGLSRYCKDFAELHDFARLLGVIHPGSTE